jgi:hypothetical protein
MTTYVVTVPGTFLEAPTAEAREALVRALRPVDPQGTDFGEAEDLNILTVYDGTAAFSLRLEVAADSRSEAENSARDLAAAALTAAGYTPRTAPLGQPVITGIDAD